MGTQLRLTNEDTQATVHVHVFENGNPFGTPTAIAPGDSAAVTVTSIRKLVITLAGVNTDDVPHATVPNVVERSVATGQASVDRQVDPTGGTLYPDRDRGPGLASSSPPPVPHAKRT